MLLMIEDEAYFLVACANLKFTVNKHCFSWFKEVRGYNAFLQQPIKMSFVNF